jgi:enediyne biosynthesis protein E4
MTGVCSARTRPPSARRTSGALQIQAPCALLLLLAPLLACSPNPSSDAVSSSQASQKRGEATPGQGGRPLSSSPSSKSSASKSSVSFSSHGPDIGVDFRYQNGESAWLTAMIESNGGGIGILDYDRDGRWDIFVPGGGRLTNEKLPVMVNNGLFRQQRTFQFSSSAAPARCEPGVCYSFGAAVGDFDADGFADVFITGYGGQQLLKNMGDGTFEDVTRMAGFQHRGWSSSAAWFDLDNDGDLDLYIAHYGVWSPELDKRCFNAQGEVDRCAPADFAGELDELWINQSDGTFVDGSAAIQEYANRGIGVVACDFDHDGDTDLYVANDEDPNSFFDNQGDGQLLESGAASGTSLGSRNIVDGSMGLAVADFDGNLKPDILVTNYQNEYCELYLNQGKQYFSLGTRSSGLMALGQSVVGWGTAFVDVDHDRDEDLLVIAGHTSRKPIKSSNLQKPYLLENIEGKRLLSIGEAAGEFFRQVHAGRGMAIADLDNDGDVDFVVSMIEQPVEVLRNDSTGIGNYLLIDLVGVSTNRDAIGVWVELEYGNETRIKHRFGGGSYASTHAGSLHVGLGEQSSVPKLSVHWPNGDVQTFTNVRANQRVSVVEGSSELWLLP